MLQYTREFIASTFFTIAIETFVLVLLIRKPFKINEKDIPNLKIIFSGFFANIATTSYVWYIFPTLLYRSYSTALITGELFACLLEATFYVIFLEVNWKKGALLSLSANASSFLLGQLLRSVVA